MRENGGQYTHASLWMAMACKGEGERAVRMLRMVARTDRAGGPVLVYRGGGVDVPGLVEEIPGLQVRGGDPRMNPLIPATWQGFRISYGQRQGP